ncbi:MAG: TrmH family RNA methyltransferase, partial [Planctomycetota bacterium]
LVGEGTADPLGLKALRASAGLALRVPFARATTPALQEALAEAPRPVWLLDRSGEDLLALSDAPRDLVLTVGGEGRGARREVREAAERVVAIVLAPGVDSLNVAVAAGIAVAHVARHAP